MAVLDGGGFGIGFAGFKKKAIPICLSLVSDHRLPSRQIKSSIDPRPPKSRPTGSKPPTRISAVGDTHKPRPQPHHLRLPPGDLFPY